MMYFLDTLCQILGEHLLRHSGNQSSLDFDSLLLLESPDAFDSGALCVASPDVCETVLSRAVSGILISAGDSDAFAAVPENPGLVFLATDLSLIALTNLLHQQLFRTSPRKTPSGDLSFQNIISRILTESGDSDEALMIMLHNLKNPPLKNMRMILIRSETHPDGKEDASLSDLLEPVQAYFPEAHVAVMPEELIVLLSSETLYCPLEFERQDFEQMLQDNHAIAMIGNPFTSIGTMRIMYHQCHRMIPIALSVRLDEEIRCMTFDRYTQYNVIDICSRSIKSIVGDTDIVILCHPGVLTLTRYDRAYGTNLRDVMFHYLMNDRSIAKTSSLLFMHRNTTIYKIKKIEELIGESMDDPYLRHNLVFSCLLLRYRELYQKEGISLSLFERPKKKRRRKE